MHSPRGTVRGLLLLRGCHSPPELHSKLATPDPPNRKFDRTEAVTVVRLWGRFLFLDQHYAKMTTGITVGMAHESRHGAISQHEDPTGPPPQIISF